MYCSCSINLFHDVDLAIKWKSQLIRIKREFQLQNKETETADEGRQVKNSKIYFVMLKRDEDKKHFGMQQN